LRRGPRANRSNSTAVGGSAAARTVETITPAIVKATKSGIAFMIVVEEGGSRAPA
jgi:hypothetical protein